MTRGPVSEQAIEWAAALAALRGTVYYFRKQRECPCDFEIVNDREVVFVTAKRTRCLHRSVAELAAGYNEAVLRLRAVPPNTTVSRELWVFSRQGKYRLFRVTAAGMEELPGPVPAPPSGRVPA